MGLAQLSARMCSEPPSVPFGSWLLTRYWSGASLPPVATLRVSRRGWQGGADAPLDPQLSARLPERQAVWCSAPRTPSPVPRLSAALSWPTIRPTWSSTDPQPGTLVVTGEAVSIGQ